jgi:hypothetical protein
MTPAASARPSPRGAFLPLAASVGIHLLLACCWLAQRTILPADTAQRISVLVRLAPPPAVRPASAPAAIPRRIQQPSPSLPAAPPQPPAPADQPPSPVAPDDSPLLPSTPLPPAAGAPTAAELLVRAKQQAGAIDRALRTEKALLTGAADHADRARTLVTDSYTSPDGVATYRFRIGGKVYCRRTGSVGPDMGYSAGAALAGAGSAGNRSNGGIVECPTGERDWVRR